MADFWINTFVAFGFTILGAFLSWIIAEPHRLPEWISLYLHSNLAGDWICAWRPDESEASTWVYDRVSLTHRLGKLRIEVTDSPEGYNWVVSLRFEKPYFRGLWQSRLPNALARGVLILKLAPQGDFLVGYSTGPSKVPRLATGRVIVAKTRAEIERIALDFLIYV